MYVYLHIPITVATNPLTPKPMTQQTITSNFDKEVKKLTQLEIRIAKSANAARRKNNMHLWWETSNAAKFQNKWETLMNNLRGQTSPQWREYCRKNGIELNYNFIDILA